MKKPKKILLILVVLIALGILGFKLASNKIVSDAEALTVEEIDFSQMEDGEYLGNYEIFPVKVSVKTKIQDGKIVQIEFLEHFNGRGVLAEKIVNRSMKKQSLQVDVISGATVSSVAIKKAVEDSLLKE